MYLENDFISLCNEYVDYIFKNFESNYADVLLEILLKRELYSRTPVLRTCYGITFQLGSREIEVLRTELIKGGVYGIPHHLILTNFAKETGCHINLRR